MAEQYEHVNVPFTAVITAPEDESLKYTQELSSLPEGVRLLLTSARSGATVRGIIKSSDLPLSSSVPIMLSIVRIAFGTRQLAQLGSILSGELRIANDKAQRVAQEIERELFAPVSLELNQYLESKKKTQSSVLSKASGPQPPNVLNLKDTKRPPAPPPVPLK